jgi:hypothetical protein
MEKDYTFYVFVLAFVGWYLMTAKKQKSLQASKTNVVQGIRG